MKNNKERLIREADLEVDTVDEVLAILRSEFDDDELDDLGTIIDNLSEEQAEEESTEEGEGEEYIEEEE